MGVKSIFLGVLAGFFFSISANAQTVLLTEVDNGLYDTGLNASGGLLSGGASDPHYSIVSSPSGTSVAHRVNGLPLGWVANTATAQWISFSSNTPAEASGTYDYQLGLTNIPAGQIVTISGSVAADDQINILANDTLVFSLTTNPNYDGSLNAFSFSFLSSGTGADILDFDVLNTTNNTTEGLIVNNLSGSYSPVPEPREWTLVVLLGACGLIAVRKLRLVALDV